MRWKGTLSNVSGQRTKSDLRGLHASRQLANSLADLEASQSSYITMSHLCEKFLSLQRQQADMDNARLHRDWLRFFLLEASARFVMGKQLRYRELCSLAGKSPAEDSAWVVKAYQEAPRALSMDAMQWSHWDTPMCPWTTWKAS